MRPVTLAIAVGLLTLGLVGCAHKQRPANVDAIFIKYDTDKNGIITKDEFVTQWHDKQKADTAWKKLDPAGNGFVTRTMANEVPFDVWSDLESQNEP